MNSANIYKNPAELLQRLIKFNTTNPPGNEKECILFIRDLLADAGINTTILAKNPNRPNLIARLSGRRQNVSPLLLYGHVDVVSAKNQKWTHPPFEGVLTDGYIWGRGALDMKGGIAMMLSAFLRAKIEGLHLAEDIVLAIVSDEEKGGDFGARFLAENHANMFDKIRYAIGEFGGFSFNVGDCRFYPIMVAEKQRCWIKAAIKGAGGHGSMPVRGEAMAKLALFLKTIDEKKLPIHITSVTKKMFKDMASAVGGLKGLLLSQITSPLFSNFILKLSGKKRALYEPLLRNTVSPTVLSGSDAINVIPNEISVKMDGRLLPGFAAEDLLAELGNLIDRDIKLEVIRFDPGPPAPDMGLFDLLADILRDADSEAIPVPLLLSGATDAQSFSKLGIQTYGFLPMRLPADLNFSQTIHGANERIPVEALDFGAEAIFELLMRYKG